MHEGELRVNVDMLEMNKTQTLQVCFVFFKKGGDETLKIIVINKWCWSWSLLSAAVRSAPPQWASCSGPVTHVEIIINISK